MRTLKALALAALIAFAVSGCKAKNETFHVTGAGSPCDKGTITGTMGGVQYALVPPGDPTSPEYLGVACYGEIWPSNVGQDFPAKLGNGDLTLTVQGNKYAYTIRAAREVSK